MALNASDVSAGDDILASHQNLIIDDIEQHTHDGTDTTAVTKLNNSVAFVSAVTRYYALSPGDFTASIHTYDWAINATQLLNNTILTAQTFIAGVHLPHGAIVTSFKVYWFRDDAAASGSATLRRADFVTSSSVMANANSDSSAGTHSVEDTSITNATIDNNTYTYSFDITLDPNDNALDVYFTGAVITYTILAPLP